MRPLLTAPEGCRFPARQPSSCTRLLDIEHLADTFAYSPDPFAIDIDQLAELTPGFSLVRGRPAHDCDGRFG